MPEIPDILERFANPDIPERCAFLDFWSGDRADMAYRVPTILGVAIDC